MTTLAVALCRETEDKIFEILQKNGFACLKDAINPEFLERCQKSVDELLEAWGHRYFSIIQPQDRAGGVFEEMASTPGFVDFLSNLARRSHSAKAVRDFKPYNVLRIIAGNDAAKTAYELHYDPSVITVLMPLYIPDGPPGKSGDLVAIPNNRGYRKSALINIAEKICLQNAVARRYYKFRYSDGRRNIFRLKPGNLYFFNGYRTFHGNLPCEAGQKRATLIFHFGDPHMGDPITRLVQRVRKIREERRLLHAQ